MSACARRCGLWDSSKPSVFTREAFPAACGGASPSPAPSSTILDLLLYDSPTGGLDPVTSTTIIELIVKQRDVYHTPSVLVTHRLQDAFTMCSHRFEPAEDRMVPLPKSQTDLKTTFLMLAEGHLIFDGSLHELVSSQDPFVREFIE